MKIIILFLLSFNTFADDNTCDSVCLCNNRQIESMNDCIEQTDHQIDDLFARRENLNSQLETNPYLIDEDNSYYEEK